MTNKDIEGLSFKGIKDLFNINLSKNAILKAEEMKKIPMAKRVKMGTSNRTQRIWSYDQIPIIGEQYGFLKKPSRCMVLTTHASKGGVLKTTLSLNIARSHALHNMKTVVLDLDPQGDLSENLGLVLPDDKIEDIQEVDNFPQVATLYDYITNQCSIEETIQETEIPSLHFIPATTELISLVDIINSKNNREEWLERYVISKLKKIKYDLIIIDLAPSWSILTSNAITSSDILVLPLETKINHYRNHKTYIKYLDHFIKESNVTKKREKIYVPVKHVQTRKVSSQIKHYYSGHLKECSSMAIKESVISEEAIGARKSLVEYAPSKSVSDDMRELMLEVNTKLYDLSKLQ